MLFNLLILNNSPPFSYISCFYIWRVNYCNLYEQLILRSASYIIIYCLSERNLLIEWSALASAPQSALQATSRKRCHECIVHIWTRTRAKHYIYAKISPKSLREAFAEQRVTALHVALNSANCIQCASSRCTLPDLVYGASSFTPAK